MSVRKCFTTASSKVPKYNLGPGGTSLKSKRTIYRDRAVRLNDVRDPFRPRSTPLLPAVVKQLRPLLPAVVKIHLSRPEMMSPFRTFRTFLSSIIMVGFETDVHIV